MPDQSLVQQLLTGDKKRLARVVADLAVYFNSSDTSAMLRMALLGLANRKWKDTDHDFKLFVSPSQAFNATPPEPLRPTLRYNENTLERFATGETERVDDPRQLAYMALYILHNEHILRRPLDQQGGEQQTDPQQQPDRLRPLSSVKINALFKSAFSLNSVLDRAREYLATSDTRMLALDTGGILLRELLKTIRLALASHDDATIRTNFFGGIPEDPGVSGSGSRQGRSTKEPAPDPARKNISFYAVYRASVDRDEIVKTFLAILGPDVRGLDCYSFLHAYDAAGIEIRRLSRGAVLQFQDSIYFISGAGNTRDGSTSHAPVRQGLETFAVPNRAFGRYAHRLLSGVQLSNAEAWQPLIGRFAMLHLGFSWVADEAASKHLARTTAKGLLNHSNVGIGLLKRADLQRDITTLCNRFGLAKAAANANDKLVELRRKFAEEAYAFVAEAINNCPPRDRMQREDGHLFRALTPYLWNPED